MRWVKLAPQPIHDQPDDPVRTVTPIRTFRYRVDTEERVEHICCLDICLDGIGLDGVVQQFSKCRKSLVPSANSAEFDVNSNFRLLAMPRFAAM